MAKIIIIGGGVAGLSAGIYARISGHTAIVCERHKIAGGNLTGWQREGYHIDNCIHWLTGTNPHTESYKLWTEVGALGNVKIYQPDSLYTCEYKGQRLSLYKDLGYLEEEMLRISPEDEKEIRSFIKAVHQLQKNSGIAGKSHNEGNHLLEKIMQLPLLYKYHKITTKELAERFQHPLLKKFFTAILGDVFSALALLYVFATFCGENGGIPQGSSRAMAKRITERFLSLGGELKLGKEAVKINYKNGKANSVTFSDGSRLRGNYVILTGDPAVSFGKLLPFEMPKTLQKQYQLPQMQRFSSYHCAFACDCETLPFKGDFVFDVSADNQKILKTKTLVIREFSHEKKFAPKGKNVLQALVFCDEETARYFIKLRRDKTEYQKKKHEIAEAIQQCIVEKFPVLKEKLRCLDVWTPATYQRYTDSEIGSFMSFILPPKALPKRIDNRIPQLKNVILATQWLQAPGGLPIAAKVGKHAIETINKRENKL